MPKRETLPSGWEGWYAGLLLGRRRGAHDRSVLERLRRARHTMQVEPGGPMDLAAMARRACFSKFHFLRLFRAAYGETPGRYLSRLRLERARALLESTDKSVTEICLEVGFESPSSFSGAFRERLGVSPQRYRRRWIAVPRAVPPPLRVPACFVEMYS